MIIDYEGARYEFDYGDITVRQAIKVEKHTGLKMTDWGEALSKGESLMALQALGWLVLEGGRDMPIEDCDFKIVKLGEAFAVAAAREAEAQKAADAARPTQSSPPQNGSTGASAAAKSRLSSPTV